MAVLFHSLGQLIAKNKANVSTKTQKPLTPAIQVQTSRGRKDKDGILCHSFIM
jgi:hypothetical protein